MDIDESATFDTMRRFLRSGHRLGEPIEIEFFIDGLTEIDSEKIAGILSGTTYTCTTSFSEETSDWSVTAVAVSDLSYDNIRIREAEMQQIAASFNAVYGGFGAFGKTQ